MAAGRQTQDGAFIFLTATYTDPKDEDWDSGLAPIASF